jgi:hypothetical protein
VAKLQSEVRWEKNLFGPSFVIQLVGASRVSGLDKGRSDSDSELVHLPTIATIATMDSGGFGIIHDSEPVDSANYTTLVTFHGYGFTGRKYTFITIWQLSIAIDPFS